VIASSDEQNAIGGQFHTALGGLVRGGATLIGYDKNIPNLAGLNKMIRVLSSLERQQHVTMRVVLVVPRSVRLRVAWQRVRDRTPTDIALNIHTVRGGEREAYRIFKAIFADECEAFLPLAQRLAIRLPGCVVTDAFWESHYASQRVAASILGLAPCAVNLEALQVGLRAVVEEIESERSVSNAARAAAAGAPRSKGKGKGAARSDVRSGGSWREPIESREERRGPNTTASQRERDSRDCVRAKSVEASLPATSSSLAVPSAPLLVLPAAAEEVPASAATVAAARPAVSAAASSAATTFVVGGALPSARGQSLVAVVHQMTGIPKQTIVAACFRLDLPVFGWDERTAPSLLIDELQRVAEPEAQASG
jgi:hypothetical protein